MVGEKIYKPEENTAEKRLQGRSPASDGHYFEEVYLALVVTVRTAQIRRGTTRE